MVLMPASRAWAWAFQVTEYFWQKVVWEELPGLLLRMLVVHGCKEICDEHLSHIVQNEVFLMTLFWGHMAKLLG